MSDIQVFERKKSEVEIRTETAATASAEQAKALVFAHYELALRHPRNIEQARQDLLKECKRPRFAEGAVYNKPIGRGVQGLSIRWAEAAVRCFRNILTINTTTFDDAEKRIVNVRTIDVETNIAYASDVTITKTVERKKLKDGEIPISSRMNSQNQKIYIIPASDDDILNKQGALISKALRNNVTRIIPGDIQDECMEEALATQGNAAAEDPDAAKRKILDSFASISVSADELKDYLGHDCDKLTPKEITELRGIYSAIRDGELSWRDVSDKKGPKDGSPREPAKQTHRQIYNTIKAQLEAAGKKEAMDEALNEFMGKIAKSEKEFDDAELNTITVALKKILEAKA